MKEFTMTQWVPVFIKFSMNDIVSTLWNFYCARELCNKVLTFEKKTTALSWLFVARLVMVGSGLHAGLASQAELGEATGERWAGHELSLSPGPPTPSGPGADQGRGRAWSGPGRGELGRPGEEEPRTRGHCDHWPESECEETWASRGLSPRPVVTGEWPHWLRTRLSTKTQSVTDRIRSVEDSRHREAPVVRRLVAVPGSCVPVC